MQPQMTHSNPKLPPVTVMIHPDQWDEMEELVRLKKNEIDKADGLVSDVVVMDELGTDKRGIARMIRKKRITRDMYTVMPNGQKKFFIKKILGLEK